jgi:hypothetical protein
MEHYIISLYASSQSSCVLTILVRPHNPRASSQSSCVLTILVLTILVLTILVLTILVLTIVVQWNTTGALVC